MEPPSPYFLKETPTDNTIKDNSEKVLIIFSDKNNSFSITFKNLSSAILINAMTQNSKLNKEYEKIYELNELKKNKFLAICDSIDEVYEQLIYEIKKNNKKTIIEENGQINIVIQVEHIKVKEMKFTLPEKIQDNTKLIKDLFNEIDILKNKNKILEEEINKLKNINIDNKIMEEIEKLKNDILFLKNENIKLNDKNIILETKINEILDKKQPNISTPSETLKPETNYDENEFDKNSSIINNEFNKQNMIINWIKEKTQTKEIEFKLIFKMTKNGYRSQDFHKHCDKKGPTLVLIKTTKNKIFGGFTPLDWENKGGKKYDDSNQTFIFSLDLMKKYDMINKNIEAIYCSNNEGPDFGASDFSLRTNLKDGKTYANMDCNFLSNYNLELTGDKGSEDNFETKEFEVYKVNLKTF